VGGVERPGHFVPRAELHRTSVHEAGHVLVAWHSTHAAAPIKVSVVPRGHTNGFAQTQDLEKSHQSEAELFDRLTVLLAGRVAEEVVLGDPSTGASNDLERATELAYEMVRGFKFNLNQREVLIMHSCNLRRKYVKHEF